MTAWPIRNLGDVATVVAGQSPEGSHYNDTADGLPFYQGKKEFTDRVIGPPQVWTRETTKEAFSGDILMSVRAPVGPVNFAAERCCIGRGLAAIRAGTSIDPTFLFYFLRHFEPHLIGNDGAVFPSINKGQIERIGLPVPPLAEQKRIVAILDEAFEGIAKATANAERNLANARELFERALVQRLTEVPVEQTASVRDLALDKRGAIRTGPFGSQLLHSEFVDDGPIAVLGIDNVVDNAFTWKRRRYITEKKYVGLQRYTVKPGDVLISIMGTCGRCAIVPKNIGSAINSKHLCCITLDKSKCLPEFLHTYFLFHPSARAYLAAQSKGSIMDGLNMRIIQEMPIDLPGVQNQKAIGEHAEILRDKSNGLGEIYKKKCSQLAELRRLLLQKAFSGQLTGKEDIAA